IEQGQNVYKYIINQYTIGDRSEDIQINKPVRLNSALDVNNVLTDQGIYEFNLIDQAGNKLTYIVVVDRTEGIVNATYGDNKNKYISGQMVADYVELEWGTHKAISLGSIDNEIIQKLINNQDIDNYYTESGNNLFNLRNMFQLISGQNLFVVQNTYTDIKLRPFDSLQDVYYILTSNGNKQIKYPNGATITGWDDTANKLFSNATNMGIKINVDEEEIRRYTFEIVGSNQVASTTNTSFSVYITPDKAQGEVYSSSQEGADYNTSVMAYGGATKYFNDVIEDENVYIEKYYEGQASNDGVFVFEWLVPSDEDNFKVTEVKYNYYQLMDQSTLNSITKQDLKDNKYPYYPYRYVEVSNNYILKTEEDIETVTAYTKTTRTTKDSYGNVIDTKSINQSDALNLAYENYYDTNGNLVSKKVTQTGLYIITRTISITVDEGAEPQTSQMSYAFFVDRNMIVGYSINDINDKIVGQFIHTAMPNSDSANGVKYDNFNKQGLKPQTRIYYDNNKEVTVEYKVYLETNKLPTLLQVPSGKYVSGNVGNMTINATSHLNLNLNLSVYFYDSYGLLPNAYKNSFVRLMNKVTSNKDGYIDLSFSNIDNPGIITSFKNARIQADDNRLSLPGVYVFVIEDTVSSKVNEQFEVYDTNEFVFGIKLTNIAPQTDVYTYADINGNKSSKVYAEDNILYTNQEFVDFIIPVEDKNAYEAQLDIASIEIWRSSASNATNSLWLRLKPGAGGSGFVADTNAIIQNLDRIYWIDVDGNIINQADGDAKERLAGYAIKLDTGLTVVDDQIVDYKEYV
ncbi:MAG: hypothetical protein J6Q15_02470, partial [Clostridia bacterium]|nr:hypothetical protein [Clostridia bacterium]